MEDVTLPEELSYPCPDCEAPTGEPCRDTCVNMTEPPWLDEADEYAAPALDESLTRIMAAVYRLPFGRLAGTPPDRQQMSLEEWADRLGDYLTTYMEVSHGQVDHLSGRARDAISLELQRDVIRQFLGSSSSSMTT